MADRHEHPPISFRPPEGDRAWLLAHAKETGRPVNALLAAALSAYRQESAGWRDVPYVSGDTGEVCREFTGGPCEDCGMPEEADHLTSCPQFRPEDPGVPMGDTEEDPY